MKDHQSTVILKINLWQGMVMHTCNSSTQEAEAGGFQVQLSLDYITSSRPDCITHQNPVLKIMNQG
jgi:hypothetical protein